MTPMTAAPKYRPLAFGVTRGIVRDGQAGTRYLRADRPLVSDVKRITDRLIYWATIAPSRTFLARRVRNNDGSTGDWRHITYSEALQHARSIGQGLLDRGLSSERPLVILSENGIEHALLALGSLYVGVPHCSVSPAYSTISRDFAKLRHVMTTLTPGLVFASDAKSYGAAIEAAVPADVEVIIGEGTLKRSTTSFSEIYAAIATPAVDTAMHATGPETITKFLFTSGSTSMPKAVINTHHMWCTNQEQLRQAIPFVAETPPVLVDWLPWSHTFGGNHNFGLVLSNGGTLYIDEGKPTSEGMAETLRNLREIAPTVYFNVPTGFESIALAMETDAALRKTLLSRVKLFHYAGASLSQPVWDSLHRTQESEIGERIVMGSGLGMTESSPFALYITGPVAASGDVGLPAPGIELKLVDMDDKTELRYRGPNITPGYWRAPKETADAFDDEGFFCSGDAVTWIDPNDIHRGLRFDGRIAEDFKLATGTFVNVGPLRAKIVAAGAPYIRDVVLTGINLREVGALVFPTPEIRGVAQLDPSVSMEEVIASTLVQDHFQNIVNRLAAGSTGSATRISRLHLVAEPPSIDKGEITDKGSFNQRAILKHRAALVEALHDGSLPFTLQPTKPDI